jgi:membrane protein
MTTKPDSFGRDARRPYQIPLQGWVQVAKRVWHESQNNNLFIISAGCAFYALFAIFPGLTALISLYGLATDPATAEQHFGMLQTVLPEQAYNIVLDQVRNVASAPRQSLGWGLAVSLGLALWSLIFCMQAMFAALNVAYEEPERRGFLRYYANALLFAVIGLIGGVVILLTVVYVPIGFALVGATDLLSWLVRVGRWPALALFVLTLLALFYRFGPCRRSAKWHWVSVGSIFATAMWLLVSVGFSIYVDNFAAYDRIYGSIGAVIVLLFWFYLSFYVILIGAQINAELELQTAQDTTVGRPRPMGTRGAYVADHVADMPEGEGEVAAREAVSVSESKR